MIFKNLRDTPRRLLNKTFSLEDVSCGNLEPNGGPNRYHSAVINVLRNIDVLIYYYPNNQRCSIVAS